MKLMATTSEHRTAIVQSQQMARAWRLWLYCKRNQISLAEAMAWDDDDWREHGLAAGLNPGNPVPSPETKSYFVQFMVRREETT